MTTTTFDFSRPEPASEILEHVNFQRMKKDRLHKLQAEMKAQGFGSLLLFEEPNVRYATGSPFLEPASILDTMRYAIVTSSDEPVLWEYPMFQFITGQVVPRARGGILYRYSGSNIQAAARRLVKDVQQILKEDGVSNYKVGIDRAEFAIYKALNEAHVDLADGRLATERSMSTKTADEIGCVRATGAIGDIVLYETKMATKPGIRENEMIVVQTTAALRAGAEAYLHTSVASGEHTNPAYIVHQGTDRITRPGELLLTDICVVGPGGYIGDISRTYLAGDVATKRQKELYRECYDWMESFKNLVRPGMSLKEVAEKAPHYPDGYDQTPLPYMSHSVGHHLLGTPTIYYDQELNAQEDKIKENMVLTNQGYAKVPGEGQGVYMEDMLLITSAGTEVIGKGPYDERLMTW